MKKVHRRLIITVVVILLGLGIAITAAGLWLTVWIPTKGKAWLKTQLEQHLPLDVTIDKMSYSLRRGFLIEEIRAVEPSTQTMWFHALQLRARIGLLALLIRQQIVFQISGALRAPCETDLVLSGRYGIRGRQFLVDLLTSDISKDRLIPQLAQHLPAALKGGRARFALHANGQPGIRPTVKGRVICTDVVLEQDQIRLTSDVTVHGAAIPSSQGRKPYLVELTFIIDQGSLEGLPILASASDVAGTIRLVDDTLEIQSLHGRALGSVWKLEGTVTDLSDPQAELILRTRIELATASAQLAQQIASWQPKGQADLALVCRGPLAHWPHLEFMARAVVQDTSVAIPGFPHRFERLSGVIQYDHYTRRLGFESLTGRIQDNPVALRGSVHLAKPPALYLTAETTADLALLQDFLPHDSPVQTLAGKIVVHLDLRGTTAQPAWQGEATLAHAKIYLRQAAKPLEEISGTIHFANHAISTETLSLAFDGQPIELEGSITDLATTPRIVCNARLANGSVAVSLRMHPDRFSVDEAALAIGGTRLRMQGQIGRPLSQASELNIAGSVELSDLAQMPWVDLKILKAWQLDGKADLQLRLFGALDAWKTASVLGFIRADALSVRGLPVNNLSAELEQGQGRMSIRLTNAMIASGRLVGECLMERRTEQPRYLFEFDLIGTDLAQLAATIPAWHGRHIQGSASCHASLTGYWKDRGSLRGQGWFHARGERLGELPLLDRLLRGFFGVLADRLGLTTLRRAQITELACQWRLAQERIATDDLRLSGFSGTEPITIYVRGSVGLDKTLDLTVDPDLSERLVLEAPNTATVASAILKAIGGLERLRRLVGRHHVGGTLDNPEYKFELSLDQILNQLLPSGLQQLFESLR